MVAVSREHITPVFPLAHQSWPVKLNISRDTIEGVQYVSEKILTAKKSGAESQLTGERAETKVKDTLLDAGIFCSKYEHDRGKGVIGKGGQKRGQKGVKSAFDPY